MAKQFLIAAGVALLTSVAASTDVSAASTRTYLSRNGSDAGSCPITAPCRTIGYALNQTAPNGEIVILDSGGYGNATITQAVSIINDSNTAIINAGSGTSITINAGPADSVVLRGLTLDGLGTGLNGIVFNSGAGLVVENCRVQNFVSQQYNFQSGVGILIKPSSGTSKFLISHTSGVNNAFAGILYEIASAVTVKGLIDHVTMANNSWGLGVSTGTASSIITVSNSTFSNNDVYGMYVIATSGALTVATDASYFSNNSTGIFASGIAKVLLSRSEITGNGDGTYNATSPNTFYTYKDNHIDANTGADEGNSPLNTATSLR